LDFDSKEQYDDIVISSSFVSLFIDIELCKSLTKNRFNLILKTKNTYNK